MDDDTQAVDTPKWKVLLEVLALDYYRPRRDGLEQLSAEWGLSSLAGARTVSTEILITVLASHVLESQNETKDKT